jgi:cyclase
MHRTGFIRVAAASLALAGLWTALTQQPPAQPLTVEKIADDLHVIVGSGGNVAVYTTPDGVILVDDKFERNVPEILEKVRSITGKPVRYILNTHLHGDHTGGNEKLLAQNAEILIHRNARANMARGNMPGLPRITFADETAIFLGGKEVRARHFGRGHTNGDAVILFPERRVLHTGDLFPSGPPFIDYTNGASAVEWPKTLRAALALEFDTVIPGHGPIVKREQLVKWIETFEAVQKRISEQRRQGKAKEEVAKTLRIDDLGWTPTPNWERSVPGIYDELAR